MSYYWEDRVHSLDMDLENARAEIQWLKDKLQRARKEGWEQCQTEAQTIV